MACSAEIKKINGTACVHRQPPPVLDCASIHLVHAALGAGIYVVFGKDFWRRTFYSPTMMKGDAPIFCAAVPADYEATVEVTCSYEPKEQFDQVNPAPKQNHGSTPTPIPHVTAAY